MAERRYLSTSDVAEALGVSVTTVKRWVDEGLLPAHKTPGGHRRLLLADVLRITRAGHFPKLDLSRLGLQPGAGEPADPNRVSGQLFTALRQGEGARTRALLLGAYQAGLAVEALADAIVAPALHRLGHEWEKGRADVLHEHRATLQCAAGLYQVKALLEGNAGGSGPRVVGGGPEKDPYLLANLLAEMVLLDGGWEVSNLGPNTPLASFEAALSEFRPQLLWLSVSYLEDAATFTSGYRVLYQEAARRGTAVVLGGRALTEEVRAGLPYTTFGDGLTHLAAFSRALHPPPRRSGRGRPLGS